MHGAYCTPLDYTPSGQDAIKHAHNTLEASRANNLAAINLLGEIVQLRLFIGIYDKKKHFVNSR